MQSACRVGYRRIILSLLSLLLLLSLLSLLSLLRSPVLRYLGWAQTNLDIDMDNVDKDIVDKVHKVDSVDYLHTKTHTHCFIIRITLFHIDICDQSADEVLVRPSHQVAKY